MLSQSNWQHAMQMMYVFSSNNIVSNIGLQSTDIVSKNIFNTIIREVITQFEFRYA